MRGCQITNLSTTFIKFKFQVNDENRKIEFNFFVNAYNCITNYKRQTHSFLSIFRCIIY